MRRLAGDPFDRWRDRAAEVGHAGMEGNDGNGAFLVPLRGATLRVIASTGLGWDHVSVTVRGQPRCPTWEEMTFVKRAFFERGEWAYELHPPAYENISMHPYCLHLWRCQYADVPLPPPIMVGHPRGTPARS